jgi:hypothetical protein
MVASPDATAEIRHGLIETRRDEPKLAYSIDEFAARAGLGRTKIYEEISAGRLVVRRVGRRRIILAGDGASYLESLPRVEP